MTPEEESEYLEGLLPSLLLALARKGLIRESDLENPVTLWWKVHENIQIATAEWRLSVALQHEFVEAASAYWKNDQKEIAVVLFATAVEQHTNFTLRMLLDAKGIEREEITKKSRGCPSRQRKRLIRANSYPRGNPRLTQAAVYLGRLRTEACGRIHFTGLQSKRH
jgi:hypothetical protein